MTSNTVTEGEILSHAIENIDEQHWRQLADVLSRLQLPDRDLDRVDYLLEKNRSASITELERAELERYLRVGSFLDLVRARALRVRGEGSSG
jgi:hypothetical protein